MENLSLLEKKIGRDRGKSPSTHKYNIIFMKYVHTYKISSYPKECKHIPTNNNNNKKRRKLSKQLNRNVYLFFHLVNKSCKRPQASLLVYPPYSTSSLM